MSDTFEHRGVKITVGSDGYFTAVLDSTTINKPTLNMVRNAIDKELAKVSDDIVISLPVIVVQEPNWYYQGDKKKES